MSIVRGAMPASSSERRIFFNCFFFFLVLNLFVAIVDFVLLTHFSLVGDKLFFRISVELNILWSPFLFTTAVFSLFIKFRVGLGDAG